MATYHDYVIKDGKFIGEFEKMYQVCENPWNQCSVDYIENSFSRTTTILNLNRLGIKSVVEFGCGLGFYTNMICRHAGVTVKGVDISKTAIERARKTFPELEFAVDSATNISRYGNFEAVLFAEITWYILNDIDEIFRLMLQHFKGKYFFHNLVFYKGQQRYGTEFFTSLKEFIEYVPFELVSYAEGTTAESDTIETSTVFRIVKKR